MNFEHNGYLTLLVETHTHYYSKKKEKKDENLNIKFNASC